MRIVGIETEYGIADASGEATNPILMSSRLVSACRLWAGGRSAPWDYGGEDPLQDQRGHRRDRATAGADMLTDAHEWDPQHGLVSLRRRRGTWEDPAHLNAVLGNGARFYVDHAHPEYSGPEVATAKEAVLWDRAGDAIALAAAERYAQEENSRVELYKNNVDGKGASYGTHENFLVRRDVDFNRLARLLTSHLVTRAIVVGAGRVGLGQRGEEPGFQISQRADYIETEIGLETTLRRPIVNTRDEPHADRRQWRRLHIIVGDANTFDVPNYLKIGTTSLVLSAIEADDHRLEALVLAKPVEAVQRVSRDLTLKVPLELESGESAHALNIQRALLEIARDYVDSADDAQVIARWEGVLDALDRDIFAAARDVEWVAKLQLLGRMRDKHASTDEDGNVTALPWDHATLAALDLQWSRLGDGWAARLTEAGAVTRLVTDADVQAAMTTPPQSTRAAIRGAFVSQYPDLVDAAGWSTVVLDRETQHGKLEVLHLDDPWETSHPLLEELAQG